MASSRQFHSQIRGRFPQSNVEDVVVMMTALAGVWAQAKHQAEFADAKTVKPAKKDYRFAASIFCVISHGAQPASLPGQVAHLVRTYEGISQDQKLYERFRGSISLGLLTMCKDAEAVLSELARTGIGGLFRL